MTSATLGQSLADVGNVANVHALPDLISLWPHAGSVMIQVYADHLETYRLALRGELADVEPMPSGAHRRAMFATLAHGGAVEVYAYTA